MSWQSIPGALRTKYLRAGGIKAARLARLVERLQNDPANTETLRALLRAFHTLEVWSAMDYLPAIAVVGQLGEHDCSTLLAASTVPERFHLDQLRALIYLLQREIRQQRTVLATAAGLAPHDDPPELAAGPRRTAERAPAGAGAAGPMPRTEAAQRPAYRALAVGLLAAEAELRSRLAPLGISLEAVETSYDAGRRLGCGLPDAVIISAELPDGTGYVLAQYLRGLPEGQRPAVVIVRAAGADGDPGILLRCGADAACEAPLDGAALASHLERLLVRRDHGAPRVLCLEEEPEEAWALREQLHEAGCLVRLCGDPRLLGRQVMAFGAELVVIGMANAGDSAGDLVRRLRSDPRAATVPIVLRVGGGIGPAAVPRLIGVEVLPKTAVPDVLAAKVIGRIERSRALHRLFADDRGR
jgi:DNA-binding response OmpR family regulator